MNPQDFKRLANNFYLSKGIDYSMERVGVDADLINYFSTHQENKKFKVAFVFICLNPLYWQYAPEMVLGARECFLPGHNTDYFFWTDIPEKSSEIREKMSKAFTEKGIDLNSEVNAQHANILMQSVVDLRKQPNIHIIPTESVDWPFPTLLRYNLFLQEEAKLKEYDYIFYLDIDMKFVNIVGDEILGEGITASVHPGYYIKKELYPPYEPNPNSASYIKRPGKLINENGKPRFQPLYFAGGFQGGRSKKFIKAMKDCKKLIETDLNKSYIPIWNDESAWNKYLSKNPPEIVLTPSYIYPDSLIKEYYVPQVWGRDFPPKIVTITKWFTINKEGGQAVAQMIKQ
jgi:hypothetical protein